MVCCADPCEDALAKQWIGLTGRGIAQTLRGQYDERAESEAGAAGIAAGTAVEAAGTAAGAGGSKFARGYVAPHGAEGAAERGIAGTGKPAGTAAAGEAGDDEDAPLRRCGPLP